MKLNETVEMMNSDDYRERFKAEYYQLEIRLNGLAKMLEAYQAGTLNFTPKCSFELLLEQFGKMYEYKNVLRTRAMIEGIELDYES